MIVRATHLEDCRFTLQAENHSLVTDQTPQYGGQGLGPMPSELLLWSVAACFGQAIRFVAARKRKNVEALALEVSGVKDTEHFRFAEIVIRVSSSCPASVMEGIIRLARQYCFVTNSLSVPVRFELATGEVPQA